MACWDLACWRRPARVVLLNTLWIKSFTSVPASIPHYPEMGSDSAGVPTFLADWDTFHCFQSMGVSRVFGSLRYTTCLHEHCHSWLFKVVSGARLTDWVEEVINACLRGVVVAPAFKQAVMHLLLKEVY